MLENTSGARTPRPASTHCRTTGPATTTPRPAIRRSFSTRPAATTRRWAATPCSATPTGDDNVAIGDQALFNNTGADRSVAVGSSALHRNRGARNIAIGDHAGSQLSNGTDNIDIGNVGVAAETKTIRIGKQGTQTKAYMAGINGTAIPGTARQVVVNGQGQLGTSAAPRPGAMLELIKQQQREIDALRREVRSR